MTDFLIYSAKVAVLIIVFYMFYRLLLSHETFHRANRVMLLLTAAASFVLPLCVITTHQTLVVPMPELQADATGMPEMMASAVATPTDWKHVVRMLLPIIYIIGVAVTLGRMLLSIQKVVHTIRQSKRYPQADGTILCVTGRTDVAPFSWMHFIVMNEADNAANDTAILAHERAHIRMRHSWDVMFVDTLTALQWFNPAMWMLRADLRAIHEYEADAAVLSQGINARQYQYLLISKATGGGGYSIANGITHSTLKNRITMMLNKKSNRKNYLKMLAALPIVAAALAVNARSVTDIVYTQQTDDEPTSTVAAKQQAFNQLMLEEKAAPTIAEDAASDGAETVKIAGRVVAKEDLSPVIGATVLIKGSKKGTVTDMDGRFSLEVPVGSTVTIAYIGRESADITVDKSGKNDYIIPLAKEGDGDPTHVYNAPEVMPQFPGGTQAMMQFLAKTIKYPEEAKKAGEQGSVVVQFIVQADGSVTNPRVMRSISPSLDKEALRVIGEMPAWTPGQQDGKPVIAKYTIPIAFRLDGNPADKKEETAKRLLMGVYNVLLEPEATEVELDGKLVDAETLNRVKTNEIESITITKASDKNPKNKISITVKKNN